MKIALCVESYLQLNVIKETIYEYAENKGLDIAVNCFSKGEEILASKERYSIVFISLEFNGMKGLEIAKQIRKNNDFSDIIFISDNIEFVFNSLNVKPCGYLKESVAKREVIKILDEYFAMQGINFPFWIKSGGDTICLKTEEIFYLEADNKHCFLHLENESIRSNCTMAKVYDILPKSHFLRINRAFVVNSVYVDKYNRDTVFLKNGEKLRLSRNYSCQFKNQHRNYMSLFQS